MSDAELLHWAVGCGLLVGNESLPSLATNRYCLADVNVSINQVTDQ
jgi:hypothetical protein